MTTAVLLPPLNPMPHGPDETWMPRLIRRGVSKGVENGRRPPALLLNHPRDGRKAVSGVVVVVVVVERHSAHGGQS